MDIREVLARNMRFYRKQADLTQEKLAEICGLHRTYIGGIEQERINVSLNNINKIAHALGVSAAALLQEKPQPDPANPDQSAPSLGEYALCEVDGDEVTVRLADMKDPDLGMQILISLIRNGITDVDELAAEYQKTERTLLEYFKTNKL